MNAVQLQPLLQQPLRIQRDKLTDEQKKSIFLAELMPHADALYNFAFHLCYDKAVADDLVQDAFLKAYRFIEGYKVGSNAKAWLFKILKNGFINDYRKKAKLPHHVDFEDFLSFQEVKGQVNSSYLDLRDDVYQNMLGDEITRAINSLNVEFRTAILLCDIEGFTYEEISKIVAIPIGTVRSRLFRARQELKKRLSDYASALGYSIN